jgi:putative PEP-CTERM system TPR-repeat lipoprotein
MQRRQYDKALTVIATLEKKQPGTALPHNLRGLALVAKRDATGARRSFERALEIDPTYFSAAANLARLDLGDGKPAAAQQRLEALLDKDSKNVRALLALAALRADAQSASTDAKGAASDEVVVLIDRAISTQPTDPAPRLALIKYYEGVKDAARTVAAAQDAVAAIPDRPELLDAAARAYRVAGESHQALTIYKKLAALQTGSPLPYLRMAEIQFAAKNKEEAMDSLRKALAIKPDLVDAQRAVIALHIDAGRTKEALSVARQVEKQQPKQSVGYVFEGDVHAASKNWTEAATVYRAGLKQIGSPDLAIRLHGALTAGGSAADAQRFASSWLKDHPKDATFRLYFAETARAGKDYASAAQHYRKLLDSEPNQPLVLNNLAWAEAQLKDPKAIEHAQKANALAPNQPAIMDTLGVLLMETGDTAHGLEMLQKASTMAPQAGGIRLNLAKALIKAGRKDAARKELDELAKLGDKFPAQSEVAQLKQGL